MSKAPKEPAQPPAPSASTTPTAISSSTSTALAPGRPPNPVYLSFTADVNPITAQGLMGVVGDQIQQGRNEIHLLLSTPGGGVREGVAVYNLLRAVPAKVVTYNVGSVNSIGNMVYLAGVERYAAPRVKAGAIIPH